MSGYRESLSDSWGAVKLVWIVVPCWECIAAAVARGRGLGVSAGVFVDSASFGRTASFVDDAIGSGL